MAAETRWVEQACEALRPSYLEMIEELAEQVRPDFESGKLRGSNPDLDGLDGLGGKARDRAYDRLPSERLARVVIRAFGLKDDQNAAAVIAASPSTPRIPIERRCTLLGTAVEAASWDLLRIARSRWCKATSGEEPSNRQLGLRKATA